MRLLLWVSLACAFTPAAVLAQDAPTEPDEAEMARAQEHFDRAREAYEAGDYDVAEADFRAAYEITQHPDMLYNIYTAAERNGNTQAAVDSLEGYLRDGDMEESRRASLEIRLERIRFRLEREAAAAETAERERQEREEALAEEQAQRERAEADARAARQAQLARSAETRGVADGFLYAGLGTLAAAAAAGIAFAVFAGLSESEDGNLAESCGRDVGRLCRQSDVDALERWNLGADISWITASGLAVVGATLTIIGVAIQPSDDPVSVTIAPALADGPGVSVRGDW